MRLTIPRLIRLLPLLIGAAQPLHAEDGGDPRPEEDACQADIHRLCDRFFPDAKLVATCLVDKRADLSPACAALLANPPPVDAEGAAPPAVPPGSSETQGR